MSSAADFFRKFQYIISPEGKAPLNEAADLQKAGARAVKNIKAKAAEDKKKEADKKKAVNVKESGSEFFRKYSDMIAEAELTESDGGYKDDPDYVEKEEEKKELAREKKRDDEAEKELDEGYDDSKDDPLSPNYKDKGEKKGTVHKVKGFAYGGSKQKDDDNDNYRAKSDPESKSDKKAVKKAMKK